MIVVELVILNQLVEVAAFLPKELNPIALMHLSQILPFFQTKKRFVSFFNFPLYLFNAVFALLLLTFVLFLHIEVSFL